MSGIGEGGLKRGRPVSVDAARVVELRRAPERYTWREIAGILGVSRSTVIRAYKSVAVIRQRGRLAPVKNNLNNSHETG